MFIQHFRTPQTAAACNSQFGATYSGHFLKSGVCLNCPSPLHFVAFLLLCFSTFLVLYFSVFFCFSASLLLCFFAFLLLFFPVFLFFCFSAFCFSASLLVLLLCIFVCLIFWFSASGLLCLFAFKCRAFPFSVSLLVFSPFRSFRDLFCFFAVLLLCFVFSSFVLFCLRPCSPSFLQAQLEARATLVEQQDQQKQRQRQQQQEQEQQMIRTTQEKQQE